jgi:hypothetical protein
MGRGTAQKVSVKKIVISIVSACNMLSVSFSSLKQMSDY